MFLQNKPYIKESIRVGFLENYCLIGIKQFRSVAFGYFGHMWELYTVWVLLPFILGTRLAGEPVLWWSFAIMGSGALGCVIGGHLVAKVGGVRVATTQLGISGLCCLLAPLMLQAPDALFYAWLLVWGITVAGDSPQFSALTASRAPSHLVGSILTMTNSIGFAISIVSILFMAFFSTISSFGVLSLSMSLSNSPTFYTIVFDKTQPFFALLF